MQDQPLILFMYSGILYEIKVMASCGDDIKVKTFSGKHFIPTVRWRPNIDG
jgi:hypothetical protein